MPHWRVPKYTPHHNCALIVFHPMAHTLATPLTGLRLATFATVPQACARALRRQQAQRHGIPTAFVSLSGVTAMLSAAVRKA